MFEGKRIIALGERDGIPGPILSQCLAKSGGKVVYETTECFV